MDFSADVTEPDDARPGEDGPRATAVIAIHLQPDVVEGPRYAAEVVRRQVLPRAIDFLDAVREAGVTVVLARMAFRPDRQDLIANSPLFERVARTGTFADGSAGADLIGGLTRDPRDLVITHQRTSALVGSPLDPMLRARGITTLLVLGVATNISVDSTARSGVDLGYRVRVVEDLCAAGDPEAHAASYATLATLAGGTTSAEVLDRLGRRPRGTR
ncbi:cysteine hydrolase family protein [Granulicoccus phenolivorans]|uniref:cysteine hydrolase family protein n=1 Tax=Granulicoccus phenolivorans TaxID=266854 RepID=UPI000407C21F|nr:cysteine hydrolase [Granulicoccus phenolivorans]